VLSELGVQIASLDEVSDVAEPAETGETFAQNARDKALYYARATGRWCLADDSGLEVDALDGAPGVHSARFSRRTVGPDADRNTIDRANNARLLAALQDVPDDRRTARFICHLALADPQSVLIEASGTVEGQIASSPAGDNGFGYDPLFYLPDLGCTAAQLPPETKNRISHRGKAVRRFAELLRAYLAESK